MPVIDNIKDCSLSTLFFFRLERRHFKWNETKIKKWFYFFQKHSYFASICLVKEIKRKWSQIFGRKIKKETQKNAFANLNVLIINNDKKKEKLYKNILLDKDERKTKILWVHILLLSFLFVCLFVFLLFNRFSLNNWIRKTKIVFFFIYRIINARNLFPIFKRIKDSKTARS